MFLYCGLQVLYPFVWLFFSRLLKKEENFIFIPRSREELPENFPKEIPGICYFLEVRSGQKPPKPSISSARMRKVSYNIGTMFLRETSLWGLLQIKDLSKKHKPRTGSWQGSWRFFLFHCHVLNKQWKLHVMSGNNHLKRWVIVVSNKVEIGRKKN